MIKSRRRSGWMSGAVMCMILAAGCGNHPQPLQSHRDIDRAPSNVGQISIGRLPLGLYPRLGKFQKVWQVKFSTRDGTGADDDRLKAFGKLVLPELRDIGLLHCPLVTDEGIKALTGFPSLLYLQLEGTSVSDAGVQELARIPTLKGINVSRCTGVSVQGITVLAGSESLEELGVSVENLETEDIINILVRSKGLKHFQIVDAAGKIDTDRIRPLAAEKGIVLVVKPVGALENYRK